MPLLSARAIWYVALMVCCKQLLRVFSHRRTTAITFSRWPFRTPIHVLWVRPFRFSSWTGQVILFNHSYSPMRLPQSFILWSAGEFTDRSGIRLTREKNMIADLSKRLFFFLAADERGTGTKPKIRGRRKKKDMWQSARWAIYEMDSGHSVLGRKWKTSEYEMFGLSLEVANQGGDTARSGNK